MLNEIRPDVLNPPAIVVQAFDEARAVEECKALIERRDEAKGEFKDAILALGQKFIEARRAMPDVPNLKGGGLMYGPAFLAFIEKCGLAKPTAAKYMSYVKDPRRLMATRTRGLADTNRYRARLRRQTLAEVSALLVEAPDLETARRIITEELNELAA